MSATLFSGSQSIDACTRQAVDQYRDVPLSVEAPIDVAPQISVTAGLKESEISYGVLGEIRRCLNKARGELTAYASAQNNNLTLIGDENSLRWGLNKLEKQLGDAEKALEHLQRYCYRLTVELSPPLFSPYGYGGGANQASDVMWRKYHAADTKFRSIASRLIGTIDKYPVIAARAKQAASGFGQLCQLLEKLLEYLGLKQPQAIITRVAAPS